MDVKQNDTSPERAVLEVARDGAFSESAFAQYWKTLGLPTLLMIGVFFVLEFTAPDLPYALDWLGRFLFLVILAIISLRQYNGDRKRAMIVNGMGGFVLGIVLALLKLFAAFAFYRVFALISEPALTLGLGLVLAWGLPLIGERFAIKPLQSLMHTNIHYG